MPELTPLRTSLGRRHGPLGFSDELPTRPLHGRASAPHLHSSLVKAELGHAPCIGLLQGSVVHRVGQFAHPGRARDGHIGCCPLQSVQRVVHWPPQLPVIGIVSPVGRYAGFDDTIEMLSDCLALIEDGRERHAAFIPQTVPDVDGFLVSRLAPGNSRLKQRANQTRGQRARDAKPRRPYGGVPLIHAGHHAATGVPDAVA